MLEGGEEGYEVCCERVCKTFCTSQVGSLWTAQFQDTVLLRLLWGCEGADKTPHHRLEDINKSCLDEFRRHWACLEQNNQQLWQCRRAERTLNACVFDNLVCPTLHLDSAVCANARSQKLEKTIPGTPENETPVHLRKRQIYSQNF